MVLDARVHARRSPCVEEARDGPPPFAAVKGDPDAETRDRMARTGVLADALGELDRLRDDVFGFDDSSLLLEHCAQPVGGVDRQLRQDAPVSFLPDMPQALLGLVEAGGSAESPAEVYGCFQICVFVESAGNAGPSLRRSEETFDVVVLVRRVVLDSQSLGVGAPRASVECIDAARVIRQGVRTVGHLVRACPARCAVTRLCPELECRRLSRALELEELVDVTGSARPLQVGPCGLSLVECCGGCRCGQQRGAALAWIGGELG